MSTDSELVGPSSSCVQTENTLVTPSETDSNIQESRSPSRGPRSPTASPKRADGSPQRKRMRKSSPEAVTEVIDVDLQPLTSDDAERSKFNPIGKKNKSPESGIIEVDELEDDDPPAPVEQPPAYDPLSNYMCPICFCAPTNAALTPCGHICCGECLFTAVRATMRRAITHMSPEPPLPRCPVCRAVIKNWDGQGGGVIGLKPRTMFSL